MKQLLTTYTFTPGAANSGTVVVPGTYALEQFLLVTNVTTGAIIYQFNSATKGGTVSTGGGNTTLTLEASTVGMSSGDRLQIYAEDGQSVTTVSGALTDTQLRASAVSVSPNVQLGSGVVTATTQRIVLASDGPTVTALNSIDGKTPALVSGRQPVDGSGVTQPISAASLPLPSGAATSAAQTTGNTSLSSIDGKLAALQSGAMPVGDNSGSLTVDGTAYSSVVSITRPANVTAYSAGDVIGTGTGNDAIITLSSIGPSGGYVVVQSIELVIGISSVPSGMTSFSLHFYDSAPTAAADNSVFDVLSGDRTKYLGYIDLPAPVDLGSTCFTQLDYPGKLFKLAAGSTSLFCELQTIGGFTPAANSEVYLLRVKTLEAGK